MAADRFLGSRYELSTFRVSVTSKRPSQLLKIYDGPTMSFDDHDEDVRMPSVYKVGSREINKYVITSPSLIKKKVQVV
jgi:hypothetical protein